MADSEMKIFIGMNRALNAIHRASDQIFRKYGLTRGQFAVLEALYHKGVLSIGCVQALVLTTGGNIPVIVRNLEKQGYLTRRRDGGDRRKYMLDITPEGRRLMDRAYPENEASIKRMIGVWTQDEQESLVAAFLRFRSCHKAREETKGENE